MKFPRIHDEVAPLGPQTRAFMERERGRTQAGIVQSTPVSMAQARCSYPGCGTSYRDDICPHVAPRVAAKRAREAEAMERALMVDQLMADAKANLLVLRMMHNVLITDAQIEERAANLVQSMIGNYDIKRRP